MKPMLHPVINTDAVMKTKLKKSVLGRIVYIVATEIKETVTTETTGLTTFLKYRLNEKSTYFFIMFSTTAR